MLETCKKILATQFMPHGHCYFWKPEILWPMVLGDAFTVLAYFTIPFLLILYIRKRKDIQFGLIFQAFAAFIFFCGMVHLMEIINVWEPYYRITAFFKVGTALVSVATVAMLIMAFPEALKIPSLAKVEEANRMLEVEVNQREESEMLFKLAVQGTTAGVWDWQDVESDKEWWSPKFYELLGYKDNEIPASLDNFSAFLHPDDKERTFDLVNAHFTQQVPFVIEYRLKHKTGGYKWFLGSGQATWNKDGKPTRMVGTIVNIDERKRAERAEREKSNLLEQKVKELEEFAYVSSHDLQEPVRTIASFVELFKENYQDKLDDEAKQYLEYMQGASLRSQQLIIDLLHYSRIGKEKELTKVDMNEIMDEVTNDLSAQIKDSNAELEIGSLPIISGYRTELRLLLQNLISNAIKFTKPGNAPKINVRCTEKASVYEFAIADNGIGIDEKYFDRIFVIFRRLHGKSEYEGTGIGLAHCKKVAELHQGKIWVTSKVGDGSTFHFTIPKKIEHEKA